MGDRIDQVLRTWILVETYKKSQVITHLNED